MAKSADDVFYIHMTAAERAEGERLDTLLKTKTPTLSFSQPPDSHCSTSLL